MSGATVANADLDDDATATTLDASRAHCRAVSRDRARNFYHGMKLVPEPKRSAMYALYAWMREADDLADEAGDADAKAAALERFYRDTERAIDGTSDDDSGAPQGPLWPAVRDLVRTYQIPRQYLRDMIDGQLLDQTRTRYKNFDELYEYCYKVASVVGLCCIEIWGYTGGAETRRLAEWRGIAFQLTNILRDVLEDAARDRVYLPAVDFNVYELNPEMFTVGRTANARNGLRRVVERARSYYDKSAPLIRRVNRDGQPCLWAMTRIYRALLDKIERDPAVVLTGERVKLSRLSKTWIALRASLRLGVGR